MILPFEVHELGALGVDEMEAELLRLLAPAETAQDRLQGNGLTAARRAGYQEMWTVRGREIHDDRPSSDVVPDGDRQLAFGDRRPVPQALCIDVVALFVELGNLEDD